MRDPETKIYDHANYCAHLSATRGGMVVANGCFDILHAGHVSYLVKARNMGTALTVLVNSDESVSKLGKKHKLVNSQLLRAYVVASLACVDYVVIFNDVRITKMLELIKPAVWVKGGDYTLETLDNSEVVAAKSAGTQIAFVPITVNVSTTKIIEALSVE